jgi:putative NADPH-quinone reductase
MKILYVNGHPYAKSYHAAVQRAYTDAIDAGHEVRMLELSALSFDPVLRFGYAKRMSEDSAIIQSQELVTWADHIVFAFPMWWGDAPALMKGWIERVFTPGFAYTISGTRERLLRGKTADIVVTSRIPRLLYRLVGNGGIVMLTRNLFLLTGIRKRRVLVLGGVGLLPERIMKRRRAAYLRRLARAGQSLR